MPTIVQQIAPGGRLIVAVALSPLEVHLRTCADCPRGISIGDGFFAVISKMSLLVDGSDHSPILTSGPGSGGNMNAGGRGSVSVGTNRGIISTGVGTVFVTDGVMHVDGQRVTTHTETVEPDEGALVFMPAYTSIITPTLTSSRFHSCAQGLVTLVPLRPPAS